MDAQILLVEDDPSIQELTKLGLEAAGFVVRTADDGEQGLERFRQKRPDAVVLDVMLPKLDGLEVCRKIRAESSVPVVMLTARDDTIDIVVGLESGADDYVTKPFEIPVLVARLRAALRRAQHTEPAEVVTLGPVTIDVLAHAVTRDGDDIELTPTEFRLLVELARHPNQVFTREILLEQVWGYEYLGDSRLVDVAIQRLRAKIEADPANPALIHTVRGFGIPGQTVIRSFRTRLVVTVIGLVAVTAAALAVGSYLLIRNSLRDQLVTDAVARADFNIGVLAGADQLPDDASSDDFADSDLARRFQLRSQDGVYVEFGSGDPYASELALIEARGGLSADLLGLVDQGRFAYEFTDVAGDPSLVVAGRRPPAGPDFFFFTSAVDVEDALDQLQRVLLIVGAALTLLGAVAARFIAGRVLTPVREASAAASTMAGGDLGVRIPVGSADEFGTWASSFNEMAMSLEQKVAALQEAQDRERRFVADVSHELRTPLTALVNEAALVNDYLDRMPDPAPRVGELLVTDVARMRRLVEDLLEISRLDAAAEAPDASSIDVARLLQAVIDARHPAAVLRATPAATVMADRRRIERIVGNLLDNARHHAPGAGVWLDAGVEGGLLSISVADDGPGVPAADVARLFDRFYMADTARRGEGTGLGLAIAREHARGLGGDLSARARDQGGLVFTATFPVTVPLPNGDPGATSAGQADPVRTQRIDQP